MLFRSNFASTTQTSNNLENLAEKSIKVLGSYLNNPMPGALKYSTPGTFISQIDYKGSTNVYSPLLIFGKKKNTTEKFYNINDPDNFYHIT